MIGSVLIDYQFVGLKYIIYLILEGANLTYFEPRSPSCASVADIPICLLNINSIVLRKHISQQARGEVVGQNDACDSDGIKSLLFCNEVMKSGEEGIFDGMRGGTFWVYIYF